MHTAIMTTNNNNNSNNNGSNKSTRTCDPNIFSFS